VSRWAPALSVEPAHLLEGGPQLVPRELGVLDEAIVLVADLVPGRVDDCDLVGLEQGVLAGAQRDEPIPLRVGEETLSTRVVRGRIDAAEQFAEEGRREIIVGGPA